jgi:hypothetical protein
MAGISSDDQPQRAPGEGRVTSFLKSGTGILTALATLIAAVAGLLTAFSQLGGGDSPQSAAATREAATTVLVESDAQRELRSHIPASIWPSCGAPVDEEEGSVAAFNCKYRTVVGLQYNLFASSQELEAAYREVRRRHGLAGSPSGGSCEDGPFEGVYQVARRDSGHLLCFIDDPGHVAAIVWTDSQLDVLSFAWRDDLNLAALHEAWQRGVGPDR